MRRFLTLITLLAVAWASATAVNGIKRASDISLKGCNIKSAATDSIHKSPALKDFPGEEYWSIGNGLMTDDMIAPLYGLDPVTYTVEVQVCAQNENYYRIIAPYGRTFAEEICKQLGEPLNEHEFDINGYCYIDLDASDPDDVYFGKTMTGCDWGQGEMYIGIATTGKVRFKNGMFTATINGLAVGDNNGAQLANKSGKFRILLPGVEPKEYDIALTPKSQCLTNRKFECSISVGKDVAKVCYAVIPNMQEDEMAKALKTIAETGAEFTQRNEFTLDMAEDTNKETLIVVALDADGNTVGYDWATYYFIDDDTSNWESVGNAVLHDAIIPQFTNASAEDLTCELQRHKTKLNYLRLVNPYATASYAQERYFHSGHNHYIYINAADKECIYIEESPIGLDFGAGMARINSYVNYFLQAGYDLDECKELGLGAVYEDNMLKFDDEMLLFSMLRYSDGDWFITNGGTTIKLPDGLVISGVDDILVAEPDNAKAELYNVMGVRITDPQKGQIYILRKGNTTRKIIF
ncbi:MAG: hypothetical protein ACI4BC_01465 [Muribaculaceae bacterium]